MTRNCPRCDGQGYHVAPNDDLIRCGRCDGFGTAPDWRAFTSALVAFILIVWALLTLMEWM